ncbi:unnamed protein product [Timema podura]|uniref:Uncharacterized protein n=1 Tax=Timema podura TaxID=61482 RepID=A0ABN7PFI4_TIMPD|nr:unnamed protein product [Timema podura]
MIIALYTGIALVTIHLISCVLLLYGAAMQIRQFLLPWMSVVLIGLAFGLTALLLAMFFGRGSTSALLVLSVVMQIREYMPPFDTLFGV